MKKVSSESVRQAVDGAQAPEIQFLIQWPEPLDEAAFHGVAGDFVRLIRDHSESDPAALLFQFLVATGNLFGRALYRCVEATHHFLNLFLVLVGPTAKGRRGTAWDWCKRVAVEVDSTWSARIQTGLSSGEGVIHAVRDQRIDDSPLIDAGPHKSKGKNRPRIIDAGVSDKRALFIQPEFSASSRSMHSQRSGKSLLAEAVGLIATGRRPAATGVSHQAEELRKAISAHSGSDE